VRAAIAVGWSPSAPGTSISCRIARASRIQVCMPPIELPITSAMFDAEPLGDKRYCALDQALDCISGNRRHHRIRRLADLAVATLSGR